MRFRTLTAAMFVLAAMPSPAHRLDEYLQGAIISVEKDRLQVQMTLTPGVAVFAALFAYIDTDADGVISEAEQRAYAAQVLHDLSLSIDGHRLIPQLLSIQFPSIDEMKEGRGEMQLDFNVDLPRGGRNRRLVFENHHQSQISAYQVNCLVPRDPNIRLAAQDRNYSQSLYQLEYEQTDVRSGPPPFASWLGAIVLLIFTGLMLRWRQRAWPAKAVNLLNKSAARYMQQGRTPSPRTLYQDSEDR